MRVAPTIIETVGATRIKLCGRREGRIPPRLHGRAAPRLGVALGRHLAAALRFPFSLALLKERTPNSAAAVRQESFGKE